MSKSSSLLQPQALRRLQPRPDSSDGALWRSNGPVYAHEAMMLTFFTALSVYATCYLLARIARPSFVLPPGSRILFEEDWVPNRSGAAKAFGQLYGERATIRNY